MAKFSPPKAAERRYAAMLKKVARAAAGIIGRHVDGATLTDAEALQRELEEYVDKLRPWAESAATAIVADVSRTNARAWTQQSRDVSRILRTAVAESAVGLTAKALHDAQVTLITSIPIEAGKRAQAMAREAATGGRRADEVAKALADTEGTTLKRAMLIARTEIAKANAALTEARAQAVGCTHYTWRTAEDGDVRESHAAMNGRIFEWASPPVVDEGGAYHPGGVYNCRCFAVPLLTEATAQTMAQRAQPQPSVAETLVRAGATAAQARRAAKAVASGKRAAEQARGTVTVSYKVGTLRSAKTVTKTLPAIDFADLQALRKLLADMPGESFAIDTAAAQAWNKRLAARGLRVVKMSGAGVRMKGVRWGDTIYAISGDTYTHKEALKAAGARWGGSSWVFTSAEDFHRFLNT